MCDKTLIVIKDIVNSIDKYRSLLENNEAQTRWLLIDEFLLNVLGYSRSDVISEYSVESVDRVSKYNSLDYCVMKEKKPKLLVEAKSLGTNLYENISQLKGYYDEIVENFKYDKDLFGVLTDGDLYLFFTSDNETNKMSEFPFYSIRLSSNNDDCEIEKVLSFSKENIDREVLPLVDIDYELNTFYRIDEIINVLNYFKSIGKKVCVDKVSLRGKIYKIDNFRTLYKKLLIEINILYPYILSQLCSRELTEYNLSVLRNLKYSFVKESVNDICINTKDGEIFFSTDSDDSNMIYRITYVLKESHYGLFNVSVSLKSL